MKKSLMLAWGLAIMVCGGAHGVATFTCEYNAQCGGDPSKCVMWGLNNCCSKCEGGGGTVRPPLQEMCMVGQYAYLDGGCGDCPDGGTSTGGSGGITNCYQPSGKAFSDAAGTGTYTGDCYYSYK